MLMIHQNRVFLQLPTNPALLSPHLAIQEQVVQHRGLHWTVELHLGTTQTTQGL